MEVAASLVGLHLAATTVCSTIQRFVSACLNAPDIAREILAEVRDFQYALNRLRDRMSKREEMTPLGSMATDATQLAITLASCTLTFSQLERIVDGLAPKETKEMSVYSRLRWTWENSNLTILVRRIQQHKSTLTLLLIIWISESSADTEDMVDSLNDILETLTAVAKAIPALATPPVSPADLEPSSNIEHLPSHLATTADPRRSDAASTMSVRSRMSFTAILRKSRPYRGPELLTHSSFSMSTSQRRGTQWSTFSIGSNTSVFSLPFVDFQLSDKPLAEEPNLFRIRLPIQHNLLHNKERYTSTRWLDSLRESNSNDGMEIFMFLMELDDPQTLDFIFPGWTTAELYVGGWHLRTQVAMSGGKNLINALLDSGASPYGGETPAYYIPLVHGAVHGNNEVTLRALLAAGVDHTTVYEGETALEFAEHLGRVDMIAILKEKSEEKDSIT
ncbi:hypothetical protein DFP73DRAFT_596202 [Morchella snyderi]|nr:hypothetical protein DFP73DRAFT_596202 [Morchella snyderi]